MTRMGDDPGKRRGKELGEKRGPKTRQTSNIWLADFTQGNNPISNQLVSPYIRKGFWTYPKEGFIQWKNE